MTVELRWASPGDAEDLALVLHEMALHYRQERLPVNETVAAVRGWLRHESPAYPHFALGWDGGEVACLASVAIAHPGVDLRRLLFLKDLFVREKFRSRGFGTKMIRYLAGECIRRGIGRIDLTTEDWNEDALRFYDRLGAVRHDRKVFLRFGAEDLVRLARPAVDPM